MLRGLEGWHIVIIVALVVLLFGSRKLPDAARSVGQSLRIFKSEMKAAAKDGSEGQADAKKDAAPQQAVEGKVVNATVTDSVPHNSGVSQP
ncbi:MAG TPA: Sec-independent protein translocase subunit TatA [Actinocrinis sp.]|nr:Sec-independent protein translocase subunit TatA [Actinocrinis sp.]